MKTGWWTLKTFLLVSFFAGILAILGLSFEQNPLPTFSELKKDYRPSDVWVMDRHGVPLESIRLDMDQRSLGWVELKELSPTMIAYLIKAEDQHFFSHSGVDVGALGKALLLGLKDFRWRGASTLTMQLVGLLRGAELGTRRSILRKVRQIVLAIKLEKKWSKQEILEAYFNLAPFRGELKGLRAASMAYFAKNPSGLQEDEMALLIALLRAPNASPKVVAKRACALQDLPSCVSFEDWAVSALENAYGIPRHRRLVPILAPEFILKDHPLEAHSILGSAIRAQARYLATSLDAKVQTLAVQALREQLLALRSQNVTDGAVLVLNTQTGEVLAYVGHGGEGMTSASQVDGVKMRRQAGSTIKPFIYAAAFEEHKLYPTSLLDDSPLNLHLVGGKVYRPSNYDNTFRGLVGASDALGSSLNIPAVRVLDMVGPYAVLALLRALGITQLEEADYYGHSLALGTIDISLWELTQAYRQLALPSSPLSAQTKQKIFNILAAPEYRRLTFGLGSVLSLPFPTAVKTGTSQDMRDNWCIGWNEEFTVGVWVGNFNGQPMWHVSGVSGAAPVWRTVMKALTSKTTSPTPSYQPPQKPLLHKHLTWIRYPTPSMLVAIDPEIPASQQKIPFEVENPQKGHHLFVNKKLFTRAQNTAFWPIQRGHYLVELRSEEGTTLDHVEFEVR